MTTKILEIKLTFGGTGTTPQYQLIYYDSQARYDSLSSWLVPSSGFIQLDPQGSDSWKKEAPYSNNWKLSQFTSADRTSTWTTGDNLNIRIKNDLSNSSNSVKLTKMAAF